MRRTIAEAIEMVLGDADRPMSPEEVHKALVGRDLYRFRADDPVHVVRSQLRRRCTNLDFPSAVDDARFHRFDGGRYGLASWNGRPALAPAGGTPPDSSPPAHPPVAAKAPQERLFAEYTSYLESLTERVLSQIKDLSAPDFETFCAKLLRAYGLHDLSVSPAGSDGGIDGTGRWELGTAQLDVAFQCKRWRTRPVGSPQVNEFRGAIAGKHQIGIFLTTSHFSKPAREQSSRKETFPIILVDGNEIVEIMRAHGFGVVTAESLPVYELDLDTVLAVSV